MLDNRRCPWCGTWVSFAHASVMAGQPSRHAAAIVLKSTVGADNRPRYAIALGVGTCPRCARVVIELSATGVGTTSEKKVNRYIWPDHARRVVPPSVTGADASLASDMAEAHAALAVSAKAAAALARRALQHMLVEKGGAKANDSLSNQIDAVLPELPTGLGKNVDAIRVVGNFSAHPIKSKDTGAITEVEPTEAEFTVDVLWDLADHFYEREAKDAATRAKLNKKLEETGKPLLKGSDEEEG